MVKEPTLMAETEQLFTETPLMSLTQPAAEKLEKLLMEKNIPGYGLRVFVAGGGCSGLQYGMAFEQQAGEFDSIVEAHGVKLYVDPTSAQYLMGASVDYVDNLMGGGFRIDNPSAVTSCGCGQSFRTKESADTGSGATKESADTGSGAGCACN